MRVFISFFSVLVLVCNVKLYSQDKQWPHLPGLGVDGPSVALLDQESFIFLSGAAITSLLLSEFILEEEENVNYYQARFGVVGTTRGTVFIENVGIEKRLSHWYSIALELNNQQWYHPEDKGLGMGLNTYYKWNLLGKQRISPFLEYGAGVFYGFKNFPPDGSKFTFNLTTQIGVEITVENQNKIRFGYGHLHQSNNDLILPNPGEDGNGFNITFLWLWN